MSSNRVPIASHSSLQSYETCSERHYRETILRIRPPRSEANHFILGSACHESIERYLTDPQFNHPVDALDIFWTEWMKVRGLPDLLTPLQEARKGIAQLYERASADYVGKDAIRKKGPYKKGSADYWRNPVADAPHMTGDWKAAMEDLGLDSITEEIDEQVRALDATVYANVSLSTVYADSHTILKGYQDPDFLEEVEYIEFPISDRVWVDETRKAVARIINEVRFPETKRLFNGYIDLVGRIKAELGGGIALLDHKSSMGPPPSVVAVAHHEQLLKYAWAWAQIQKALTGVEVWPKVIGINHLRTGTYVLAPVDQDLARAVVKRADNLVKLELAGVHYPKDPFAYNSPCLRMGKDGVLQEYCPHLLACHPTVAKALGLTNEPLKAGF